MTVKINADTSDGLKLVSDTSGAIDFQSNGVTKMSMDSSGNLTANSFVGAGKVLQVVQTVKSDVQTVTSSSYTNVMTVDITPSSSSNKILIIYSVSATGVSTQAYFGLFRDSTQIGQGDANGSRVRASTQVINNQNNEAKTGSFTFLDSPSSSSQITYALKTRNQGSGTIYINRSNTWTNSANSSTNCSTITVMEIQA
jgi:hypothetical protein